MITTEQRALAAFDAGVAITAFMTETDDTLGWALGRLRAGGPEVCFVALAAWVQTFMDLSGQTDYVAATGVDVVTPGIWIGDPPKMVPIDKVPVRFRPRAKAAQFATMMMTSDGWDAARDLLAVMWDSGEWDLFVREVLWMAATSVREALAKGV